MSLRLGLFYPNARTIHAVSGAASAQNPDVLDLASHIAVARAAEEIGLDYLFMADAWGSYGPTMTRIGLQDPMLIAPILAATLIPVTTKIRLITTLHTSWFDPLLIVRTGAALDCLSGGRWGVNLVSGTGFADPLLLTDGNLDHDARYVRASEAAEVMTQHWSRGRVDFAGTHFNRSGALVGPATMQQPRPLIVSAGASPAGCEFAGRYADYIFMPGRTPRDECLRRVNDIRAVAARCGRNAASIKMQMHASIIVRPTAEEARKSSEQLAASVDLQGVAEYLNAVRSNISTYDDIYASLGELQMRQIGSVSGARKMHGDPRQVADAIEHLVGDFGCDGLALSFPCWQPEEILGFGRSVLPILERRGLWAHPRTRNFSW